MRLIDGDDLFTKIRQLPNTGASWLVSAEAVFDAILKAPTIEPRRMKGKWIHDGYDIPHGVDWMHCSVCGRREPYVPAAMTNYCPNCGADMRGEQDGKNS